MGEDLVNVEPSEKNEIYKLLIIGLDCDYKEALDAFRNFQTRAHNLSALIGGIVAAMALFMKADFTPTGNWQKSIAALMIIFASCAIGLSLWVQKKHDIPSRFINLYDPEKTLPNLLKNGTPEEIQARIREETITKTSFATRNLKATTKHIANALFWAQTSVVAMFVCYFTLALLKVRS